jgi:hypothetical protein
VGATGSAIGEREKMRWTFLMLLTLAAPAGASPRDWVEAHHGPLLTEYQALLTIPNVASNRADIRRNADHIVAMMGRRGPFPAPARKRGRPAPPLIYGEWRVAGAARTYVIYAHYDGQPVTPADWTVTPFPVVLWHRGGSMPIGGRTDAWRLCAQRLRTTRPASWRSSPRSTRCAPKGDAELQPQDRVRGRGGSRSPHLAGLLRRHRELLRSDGWVIIDGRAPVGGRPQLTLACAARDRRDLESTARSAAAPQRPLRQLGAQSGDDAARVLATMKDEDGRVTIRRLLRRRRAARGRRAAGDQCRRADRPLRAELASPRTRPAAKP